MSLLQTWEYAQAKTQTAQWEVWQAAFSNNGTVVGAVQGMVWHLPWVGGGLVWINRGPLWNHDADAGDPSLLSSMLKEVQQYWVEQRGMYLRIAPPALENDTFADTLVNGNGNQKTCGPGWASARVDLAESEETLRRQLQQKWRNCLNKAERLGLIGEYGSDDRLFNELMTSYEKMLVEKKFQTNITPTFLAHFRDLLPDERKPWVFTASHEGEPLGGILVVKYGDICEYLVGSINDTGRNLNAGQFLLWQAVCQMKSLGCRWFDVGGMDSELTPAGIYHFKAGLGGTPYRLVNELESCDGSWRSRAIRWYVTRAITGAAA